MLERKIRQTRYGSGLSRNINGIYVGSDLEFLSMLRSYDPSRVSIVHCANASSLLETLENSTSSIDLILSEFDLSDKTNGLTLHSLVKEFNDAKPLFALLCSSNTSHADVEKALERRVDDVIFKSLSCLHLFERIQFLCNHKNQLKKVTDQKPLKNRTSILKRLFDILVASVAILLLSPVFIIITILIKIDSRGPVLFISKRVGKGYQIFNFYKFRSMKTGSEKMLDGMSHLNQYGDSQLQSSDLTECEKCNSLGYPCSPILFASNEKQLCENLFLKQKLSGNSSFTKFKNDPRITKLGKFLRKTSLDELPQLLNILKGDMSIVGNRPLPLYEAELLTTDAWTLRFLAPAGLTGLWQITKRGKNEMSEKERKELDNNYAENHSIMGDIRIILKTIPALFQEENV